MSSSQIFSRHDIDLPSLVKAGQGMSARLHEGNSFGTSFSSHPLHRTTPGRDTFDSSVMMPCMITTLVFPSSHLRSSLSRRRKPPTSPCGCDRAGTAHDGAIRSSHTVVTELCAATGRKLPKKGTVTGFRFRCHSYMNAQG